MNKFLALLVFVSSVSFGSLVASEANINTLNKTDSELLFGVYAQNADTTLLSEDEMKDTKGEGLLGAFVGGVIGGIAGAIGGDIWDEIKSWF